jgi:hypothetical protein
VRTGARCAYRGTVCVQGRGVRTGRAVCVQGHGVRTGARCAYRGTVCVQGHGVRTGARCAYRGTVCVQSGRCRYFGVPHMPTAGAIVLCHEHMKNLVLDPHPPCEGLRTYLCVSVLVCVCLCPCVCVCVCLCVACTRTVNAAVVWREGSVRVYHIRVRHGSAHGSPHTHRHRHRRPQHHHRHRGHLDHSAALRPAGHVKSCRAPPCSWP